MNDSHAKTKSPSYDISAEGQRLVNFYQQTEQRVKAAKSELNCATTELHNSRDALIKWCSPKDAKPGEKFGIWSRDQYGNEVLIEATTSYTEPTTSNDLCQQLHEGTITFRYRK